MYEKNKFRINNNLRCYEEVLVANWNAKMDVILIILCIVIALLVCGLYKKNTNKICRSKKRLDGMTCLVTGGTRGIGLEIAKDFASRGARVIIACPYVEEGNAARKAIIEDSENENVVFKLLDLASLKSVRQFADDIINNEHRLDILMNNAGVGIPRKKTEDGMNLIMQVNYLGPFLLTLLLIPLLKKSGKPNAPSRIVNTSSITHYAAWLDVDQLAHMRNYHITKSIVYSNSKLCLLLFSLALKKRNIQDLNIVIHDADPGEVGTGIFSAGGYLVGRLTEFLFIYLAKTPFEGAQTPIHAALDVKAGMICSKFFRNCEIREPSSLAQNKKIAEEVWEKSLELVKLSDFELKNL